MSNNYEGMSYREEPVKFHITYDDDLKLSELSTCLELISKGSRKFIQKSHLESKHYNELEPIITGVGNGSVVIDVLFPCIVQVSIGLLTNLLYDVFKKHFSNKVNIINNYEETYSGEQKMYKNNVFEINFEKRALVFI